MNCDAIGPDLSAYLDGEIDEERRGIVESHLAACPDCRSALARFRESGARLCALDRSADPAGAILAALGRRRESPRFRVAVRSAAAVAAVVAAAALFLGPVRAEREAARIVDLDARVRIEATREIGEVEAARLELTALYLRLGALEGADAEAARDIASAAEAIAERAAEIESRLRGIRDRLDRDRLIPLSTEVSDDGDSNDR